MYWTSRTTWLRSIFVCLGCWLWLWAVIFEGGRFGIWDVEKASFSVHHSGNQYIKLAGWHGSLV